MAGEIVALGEDVNPNLWKVGDRVSANFTQDHVDGDLTPEAQVTALGGSLDGGLAEYQTFPAYVSAVCIVCIYESVCLGAEWRVGVLVVGEDSGIFVV